MNFDLMDPPQRSSVILASCQLTVFCVVVSEEGLLITSPSRDKLEPFIPDDWSTRRSSRRTPPITSPVKGSVTFCVITYNQTRFGHIMILFFFFFFVLFFYSYIVSFQLCTYWDLSLLVFYHVLLLFSLNWNSSTNYITVKSA